MLHLPRRGRRVRVSGAALATITIASGLSGCGGTSGTAAGTLSAFLSDWNRGDTTAMARLVDRPAPGFASTLAGYTAGLHAVSAQHRAGPVTKASGRSTASITSTYRLPGVGPWTVTTMVGLAVHKGRWSVEWTPAAVAPGLPAGGHLAVSYRWAPRAPILGAGGAPLTTDADEVLVGLEGSRIKDQVQLTSVLEAAGAPAASVRSALAAAAAHPTFFEPVFALSAAAYAALGGNKGTLYAAPGTVFQHVTRRTAVTAGLAAHLVGSVGPITSEELARLGPPYSAASVVGQNGLEAAYEKQLAGTPGAKVEVVGADGRVLSTLQSFDPRPGTPVRTTIDPAVQRAAESALATVAGGQVQASQPGGGAGAASGNAGAGGSSAGAGGGAAGAGGSSAGTGSTAAAGDSIALVAVSVTDGSVLASASLPSTNSFDAAFDGEFPPGSTFKILTSTALFEAGLTPSSPASCPPTATIDGKAFHNAEGDQPVSTLAGAFTESCNTAFVQLAASHLRSASFPAVASSYDLGVPFRMGLAAFSGTVPRPADNAALAASAIGQGSVVVSPLSMAMVAAAVGSGTARLPRLVDGSPDDADPGRPVSVPVVSSLRQMMASVVTSGTAAGTGLPSGTHAKTGTAEYGSGPSLPLDAWLVGYHDNVAFAMVVQNSKADGGPTDGPVVARFLNSLPASAG